MHVEALNWSGASAKDYAGAHRISVYTPRTWRARLDADPLQVDWRARLHPSLRALISTSVSDSAKDPSAENVLTPTLEVDPAPSDRKHRRTFTDVEKRAIVFETKQPGATVSQEARAHGLVTSVLFRWRAEFGFGKNKRAKLATVIVADGRRGTSLVPLILRDLLQPPDGMTAVELDDGRRVFAPVGGDPETVRQYVLEQEAAR